MTFPRTLCSLAVVTLLSGFLMTQEQGVAAEPSGLTLVIMDPLAAPLSCPCVKGYAQRNYDKLGNFLSEELGVPVQVVYAESLEEALDDESSGGRADIVIGKRSVVASQAKRHALSLQPELALTGKDGQTTQTGLIVVGAADPAQSVKDLKGYRIIFGVSDCDEKHKAALDLLRQNGVAAPTDIETCAACSDGATTILELGPKAKAATVISSYAAPLLEGCGTIKKGDLRVVGTTAPVPFVTAFVSEKLTPSVRMSVIAALKEVGDEPSLLLALETKAGFVAEKSAAVAGPTAKKKGN
ncbi:MAG: PhnD/SsuA/transferrin family substrate-binding protein [Planctomycetales bacterium]